MIIVKCYLLVKETLESQPGGRTDGKEEEMDEAKSSEESQVSDESR